MNSKDSLSGRFREIAREKGLKNALSTQVNEQHTDPLEEAIFGKEKEGMDIAGAAALGALTFGDLIYDVASVDPMVFQAWNFASADGANNIFDFGMYASDRMEMTGDVATGAFHRLKGYVAEQFVAKKLNEQGYEVEFPPTGTQAGWDLLVDGQEMQVKCVGNIDQLHAHFETYPDIPVLANSDIAENVLASGEPWAEKVFYVEDYDIDTIESLTSSSVDSAAEIFDYEIPLFVTGFASARNLSGWWKGDLSLADALTTTAVEIGAKLPLAGIGAVTGQGVGLLLFGPAGGYVFGGLMAVAGASQSRNLVIFLKEWLNQGASKNVQQASYALLNALEQGLLNKIQSIDRKISIMGGDTEIAEYVKARLIDEKDYFFERLHQLNKIKIRLASDPTNLAMKTFEMVRKSKVHPALYQEQFKEFLKIFEEASSAIKGWPQLSNIVGTRKLA